MLLQGRRQKEWREWSSCSGHLKNMAWQNNILLWKYWSKNVMAYNLNSEHVGDFSTSGTLSHMISSILAKIMVLVKSGILSVYNDFQRSCTSFSMYWYMYKGSRGDPKPSFASDANTIGDHDTLFRLCWQPTTWHVERKDELREKKMFFEPTLSDAKKYFLLRQTLKNKYESRIHFCNEWVTGEPVRGTLFPLVPFGWLWWFRLTDPFGYHWDIFCFAKETQGLRAALRGLLSTSEACQEGAWEKKKMIICELKIRLELEFLSKKDMKILGVKKMLWRIT